MAVTFPYPLAYFWNTARIQSASLSLRRYDETSGGGDGRIWTAEMAPPLWTASVTFASAPASDAREFEAKVDGLDGSRGTFLFADPTYTGPASGMTEDLGSVSVSGIRADRGAISLTGLPPGFILSPRDRLCIPYGSGRVYFGTFLEGATAGSLGNIADARELRPYLPFGIAAGASVRLVRPYFKAIIEPGGWTPYTFQLPGDYATGAAMRLIQKP